MKQPFIIGVSGGSGSGKTYFISRLQQEIGEKNISVISLDNYYKPKNAQSKDAHGVENYDLPDALDIEKFNNDLRQLMNGNEIWQTEYTFNNKDKASKNLLIKPASLLLVEGIFIFHFPEILSKLNLKIFLEVPENLMLTRRIYRDSKERGYDLSDVTYRFENHVMPAYKKYIEPLKSSADIIVPNEGDSKLAIEVIVGYLHTQA